MIQWSKPVPSQEEVERLVPLAQAGDSVARESVVMAVYRLLAKEASQFARRNRLDIDDCISEALLGVVQSLAAFSPQSGKPFVAWATVAFRNDLRNYKRRRASLIRRPQGKIRTTDMVRPSYRADRERAAQIRLVRTRRTRKGGTEVDAVSTLTARPEWEDPTYTVWEILSRAHAYLDDRRWDTLALAAQGVSLAEIGARLGVSAERARQLFRSAAQLVRENEREYA